MEFKSTFRKIALFSVIVIVVIPTLLASAATFTRISGSTYSSGSGVSVQWAADKNNGTVKILSTVDRNWYNVNVIALGKSQAGVCKTFSPSFTGNAKIKSVYTLNGELRAETKSFWKIPSGVANADVQVLMQIGGQMNQQGVMFVGSQVGIPHSWTANSKVISFEKTVYVTKGKAIEVCAGIMSNASVALGGGIAYADFSSSRFSRSYIQDITLSK